MTGTCLDPNYFGSSVTSITKMNYKAANALV